MQFGIIFLFTTNPLLPHTGLTGAAILRVDCLLSAMARHPRHPGRRAHRKSSWSDGGMRGGRRWGDYSQGLTDGVVSWPKSAADFAFCFPLGVQHLGMTERKINPGAYPRLPGQTRPKSYHGFFGHGSDMFVLTTAGYRPLALSADGLITCFHCLGRLSTTGGSAPLVAASTALMPAMNTWIAESTTRCPSLRRSTCTLCVSG